MVRQAVIDFFVPVGIQSLQGVPDGRMQGLAAGRQEANIGDFLR